MAAAGRRRQQLLLGLLTTLCCCCGAAAAADPAAGSSSSLLRSEEGALTREEAQLQGDTLDRAGGLSDADAAASATSEGGSSRLLRYPGVPCHNREKADEAEQWGLLPGPPGRVRGGIEVPDWSHGIYAERREREEKEESRRRVKVDFEGPIPPFGSWAPVSFSGYGSQHPMGPLLLACSAKPSGRASCDVLHDGSRDGPGLALYRAWSMWGDRSTGRAYVSLLPGAFAGQGAQGAAGVLHLACCETTNNAEGCVACTGFPSTNYNPLNLQMQGELETDVWRGRRERPHAPRRRWPAAQAFDPVEPEELFQILPNLREQLGPDAHPEHLPCEISGSPNSSLPTLGDIFRSRKDLSLLEAMVSTSQIQQLVPCELTFIGITDDNAKDFQGHNPPPCLFAALGRPENQREMLQLLGRNTLLGRVDPLPISSRVPLLYGSPAKSALWGSNPTWNNIQLTGEKIPFDRGVIHLLSRNDMNDIEGRELLRRIVYWCCLHDHLVHHPALTRFALIMVDNNRALPIIGAPPGLRPDWVAKGNQGWFPPPTTPPVEGESSQGSPPGLPSGGEGEKPEKAREEKPANERPEEEEAEGRRQPETPGPEQGTRPKEEAKPRSEEEEEERPRERRRSEEEEEERERERRRSEEEEEEERPRERRRPEEEEERRRRPEEEEEERARRRRPEEEEERRRRRRPEEEEDRSRPRSEEEEERRRRRRPEEEEERRRRPEEEEERRRRPEEEEERSRRRPEEEEERSRRRSEEEEERRRPRSEEEEERSRRRPEEEEERRRRRRSEEEEERRRRRSEEEEERRRRRRPEEEEERSRRRPEEEEERRRRRPEEEEERRRRRPEEEGRRDSEEPERPKPEAAAERKPEEEPAKRRPEEEARRRPEEEEARLQAEEPAKLERKN